MPLQDIVNVQITRQTQAVQQAGFGLLMILGTFKRFNDLIRKYTSMEGVAEDFRPSDAEYVAAQAVFSQTVTPDAIFIGRRPADSATIEVISAMPARNYTVTINGTDYTLSNSTNTSQQSAVQLNADFVANNLISVRLNNEAVGTIKSIITYNLAFTSGTLTTTTINGQVIGAPVPYTTSNSDTLAAIASQIESAPGVDSAIPSGTSTITITFDSPGDNTVNSSVTTGGSAPTATIVEGGFFFDTDQLTTMSAIQAALNAMPTVQSVELLPSGANPNRILAITTRPNQSSVITDFTTYLGASQPVATIETTVLPTTRASIANALAQLINDDSNVAVKASQPLEAGNSTVVTLNGVDLAPVVYATSNAATLTAIANLIQSQPLVQTAVSNGTDTITITPTTGNGVEASFTTTLGASQPTWTYEYDNIVNAIDNGDGTLTVESTAPGAPWTLDVSTNIINANRGRVTIQEANPDTVYSITLNNTLIQYTAPTDVQNNEQIATALVGLINASPVAVSATDNGDGSFDLESNDLALTFRAQITPILMTYNFGLLIEPLVPSDTTVIDSLDAIQAVNNDWYALALLDRTSGTVQEAASWIEARTKIFGTASDDPNIINVPVGVDQTSIAAILNNLGYVRTFVLYHQDANSDYPECAWFGDCLPLTPGSETWAFKTLSSIAYSDLSANQSNNARSKRANTYEYVAGFGITQNGTMAQGEYIDIIRGVDWLTSTIQAYVFTILVQSPKLPYTDAGITAVEAQVRRALNEGITNNFIASTPEYTVTVPRASEISSADKAARILRNVRFQATLAGAIQAVRINGTVVV